MKQKIKTFLKQLVPPILLKVLKNYSPPPPLFKTYEEALKCCPNEAYEGKDLVKVVVEKNLIYRQKIEQEAIFDLNILRGLIGLGLAKTSNSLKVIDFGGGGGSHFTIASKAFGDTVSFKWNVIETSAMANQAQRIATQNLKFFDSIVEALKNLGGSADLVFTSGALHTCSEPLFFLKELINVKAKYLFITRTAFTESSEQIVMVQKSYLSSNGPGQLPSGFKDKEVFYPNVFVPKSKAEEILSEFYDIQFKIIEDKAAFMAGKKEINMFGYFCVRKS